MRFALLNSHRLPVSAEKGTQGSREGEIHLFLSEGPRVAPTFTWREARSLRSLGVPIPALLARLLGWQTKAL